MNPKFLLLGAVVFSAIACGSNNQKGAPTGSPIQNANDQQQPKTTAQGPDAGKTSIAGQVSQKAPTTPSTPNLKLQITVLNFLKGGLEPCNLKNKIFTFHPTDQAQKQMVCKNSKVEVDLISNVGSITFKAIDLSTGKDLESSAASTTSVFTFGKDKSLRYGTQNPYGFTYVLAEDMTGVDPNLLDQWNTLNDKYTHLLAQVLTNNENQQKTEKSVLDDLTAVKEQMNDLAKKMRASIAAPAPAAPNTPDTPSAQE